MADSPKPPFESQSQPIPGSTDAMRPRPDHGEDSYKGSGRLKDKKAIITGGDSGIGRAVAIAYAREGAEFSISYLNEDEDADETKRLVEEAGRKAVLVPGDIPKPPIAAGSSSRRSRRSARIDILVNNAAHQASFKDIEDITDEEWELTFKTNIHAMFYLTKAAVPHMKRGQRHHQHGVDQLRQAQPDSCLPTPRPRARSRTSPPAWRSCWPRRASARMRRARADLDAADPVDDAGGAGREFRQAGADEAPRPAGGTGHGLRHAGRSDSPATSRARRSPSPAASRSYMLRSHGWNASRDPERPRRICTAAPYATPESNERLQDPATTSFFSPYRHHFVRVAACVPRVAVADRPSTASGRWRSCATATRRGSPSWSFPSWAVVLRDRGSAAPGCAARRGRGGDRPARRGQRRPLPGLIVGAPLRVAGRLYNTAVVIHRGEILGRGAEDLPAELPRVLRAAPFRLGRQRHRGRRSQLPARSAVRHRHAVPLGRHVSAFTFHVEICEDIWVPPPPSTAAALAGREMLLNLSASNITIGKAEDAAAAVRSQSRGASRPTPIRRPGPANRRPTSPGTVTRRSTRWRAARRDDALREGSTIARADVDLGRIRQERMRNGHFADCALVEGTTVKRFRTVDFALDAPAEGPAARRPVERFPYVPSDPAKLRDNCYEAYNIQVQGLAQRLQSTRIEKAVIGVSGGLDSTQALIVCCRAMDQLGLPRANILAYTLPGFATSEGTKGNAWRLMRALGVTAAEIDIRPAARQMLADIGHPFAEGEEGLRRDLRERAGGLAHRLSVPSRQPAWRPGRRHRRSCPSWGWAGAPTASAIRCRTTTERLGLQDADPAPDPLRRRLGRRRQGRPPRSCTTSWTPRSRPS